MVSDLKSCVVCLIYLMDHFANNNIIHVNRSYLILMSHLIHTTRGETESDE